MANEITLRWSLDVTKGNLSRRLSPVSQSITLSAASPAVAGGVISVGTTHEAIPLGDLAGNGIAWVRNLETTNYLEIGVVVSSTFYPLLKLKAGESFPLRIASGVAPYAKANTAACRLDFEIYDD